MKLPKINIGSTDAVKHNSFSKVFLEKYKIKLQLENQYSDYKSQKDNSKVIYSSYLEVQLKKKQYLNQNFVKQQDAKNKSLLPKRSLPLHQAAEAVSVNTPVERSKNWMEDYEFYDSDNKKNHINLMHNGGDIIDSTVPCGGCGAYLHCGNPSVMGYISAEIFKGRTKKELQTIICQRCHFLRNFNIALEVKVSANSYVETVFKIKNQFALAVVIVDLLDFPCSIWPNIQEILGPNRPIFIVGNKVDLLPRDSIDHLEHIKKCLMQQLVVVGFDALNIKSINLVSAKTGYGIEELITRLHKIWKHNGDVYLLGCTNVGKSTLFNMLLSSDYCRPEATDVVPKATVCPWPGTTLQMLKFPILRPSALRVYQRFRRLYSERAQRLEKENSRSDKHDKGNTQLAKFIGTVERTFHVRKNCVDAFAMSHGSQPIVVLNENKVEFQKSRWCYDTPGVLNTDQITNLLTAEEIVYLIPEKNIFPRAFRIKLGMSIFLAGLARLDFSDYQGIEVDWITIFVFTSLKQPVSLTLTKHADTFYQENLGTEILGIPSGTKERLKKWPGLHCKSDPIQVVGKKGGILSADILLSSVGWIGVCAPYKSRCIFRAWTPYERGIRIREPALIPHAKRLVGKKIRNSYAYNMAKPINFIKGTKWKDSNRMNMKIMYSKTPLNAGDTFHQSRA